MANSGDKVQSWNLEIHVENSFIQSNAIHERYSSIRNSSTAVVLLSNVFGRSAAQILLRLAGVHLFALVLAVTCSGVTMSAAWLFYRPLVRGGRLECGLGPKAATWPRAFCVPSN